VTKEDNKLAMAALQQEFEGKLAQEIVVRERLSEELASAKGELAAAASACQEQIVTEVEKARVALHSNYDRTLVASLLAAEKKYAREVEGMKKKIQEYKEKYDKECAQHLKLKDLYKKVGYNTAM
jgi:bacillopeptidase F (M6 metalloprotease family)